jgi:hypothetical protein
LLAQTPPLRQVGQVTAPRRARARAADVPGNVTVIDREEIERSGARTLPELLRREAGLFVTNTSTNPAGTFVDARGFNNGGGNGSCLLVLVDGVRQNEPDTARRLAAPARDDRERRDPARPRERIYGDGASAACSDPHAPPGAPRAERGLYGLRHRRQESWLRKPRGLDRGLFSTASAPTATSPQRVRQLRREGASKSLSTVVGSSGGHHHDDRASRAASPTRSIRSAAAPGGPSRTARGRHLVLGRLAEAARA